MTRAGPGPRPSRCRTGAESFTGNLTRSDSDLTRSPDLVTDGCQCVILGPARGSAMVAAAAAAAAAVRRSPIRWHWRLMIMIRWKIRIQV